MDHGLRNDLKIYDEALLGEQNEVIQIGGLKFEVVKVSRLKLNPDNTTAEVVLDVKAGDRLGEFTIHKLNLITMKIEDTISENMDTRSREIFANMSIDTEGEPYTIKFI